MSSSQALLAKLLKQQSQRVQPAESMTCSNQAESQQTTSSLSYVYLTQANLSYSDWRILHEWLAPLPYIKPADRIIYDPLMILLINKYGFQVAQAKSYFIPVHIDLETQKELTQWIPDPD